MMNLLYQVSKYLIILFMAFYTLQCYTVFRKKEEDARQYLFLRQNMLMFFMHFVSYVLIYLQVGEVEVLIFYGAQVLYFLLTIILFRVIYPLASRLLINNMCMLLCIGFIIIARLDYDECVKQFIIVCASTVLALLIPVMIRKLRFLTKMYYAYTLLGIGMLLLVAVAARSTYGAKLSISIGGLTIQLSEFVKIVYVFAIAGLLSHARDFRRIVIATILAAAHVLILVVSKDLGSAVIFFITYLVMLFIATRNPFYTLAGVLAGAAGSVAAYFLFYHVRVRVQAWLDPFADYQVKGYQTAQALFSIAAGGWFGTGLYQGSPTAIPVVEQDMVFAAIVEELGGIFGICLILVCMSCFIMFVNIGMQLTNRYYRLVAIGLGTTYAVQVFLTIGGTIKLIPLTGVTLPLVSYGGSSVLSTIIMFAIVQGLYMLRNDEEASREEKEAQRIASEQRKRYGAYGYPPNGRTVQNANGYPPNGYAAQDANGYPPNGRAAQNVNGYPPNGRAAQNANGYPPNGRAAQNANGYPPNGRIAQNANGYPPNGRTAQNANGYPPNGRAAQNANGYPPNGRTAQNANGYPPNGRATQNANGYPPNGYAAQNDGTYPQNGRNVRGYAMDGRIQQENDSYSPNGYSQQNGNAYGAEESTASGEKKKRRFLQRKVRS